MSLKKHKGEEDIVIENEGETTQDVVKKLRERLKKCEHDKQEYLTGWQRSKADFINARREEEKKRANITSFAEENLIKEFLVLADSFDSLFSNKDLWQKLDKEWQKGIQNIYTQYFSTLTSRGLKMIETKDKELNYEEHETVGEVFVDKSEKEGIVIEEIRRGYKLNEKVIRPAQVKVGKLKE